MHSRTTYQIISQMERLSKNCLFAFLSLLFLLSPFLIFEAEAQTASDLGLGVIRIMPDGTVEGTDKIQRNGNVYTLTDDISVQLNNTFGLELKPCLLIMKDNIVVDGAGHTISSNGTGLGIYARGVQGVTIKNFVIRGFVLGISSYVMDPGTPIELLYKKTSNNQIINNDIEVVNSQTPYSSLSMGIFVEFSEDILVSGNTIKAEDSTKGLYVGATCNRTTITNNNFIGCGLDLYTLKEKTMSGNTIDGKPVVFLSGKSNEVVDFGEQVFVYN
jgi:parallel beta-helix repeat protein